MANPGDKITIRVNGKPVETVIDEQGVQRFRQNSVLDYLFQEHMKLFDSSNPQDRERAEGYGLDLNKLAVDYHKGKFTKDDYGEIMMMLGYSVSGFCDLSAFQDWEIENPLWDEEPDAAH
jgi:hypothetical protein